MITKRQELEKILTYFINYPMDITLSPLSLKSTQFLRIMTKKNNTNSKI